ncbi:MAG: hypothetical protein GY841_02840 [FCB group bacterium]|nr:hypothetical protein [FCB group bacterium]
MNDRRQLQIEALTTISKHLHAISHGIYQEMTQEDMTSEDSAGIVMCCGVFEAAVASVEMGTEALDAILQKIKSNETR